MINTITYFHWYHKDIRIYSWSDGSHITRIFGCKPDFDFVIIIIHSCFLFRVYKHCVIIMSRIYDNKPLLNLPLINVELGQWNQEAMTGYDYISEISKSLISRHNCIISGCKLHRKFYQYKNSIDVILLSMHIYHH